MTSPPIWKRSWTRSPPATLDWKQLLRDFWKDFSAAVGETKDLKISQVIDELDSRAGPAHLPGRAKTASIRANAPPAPMAG